jgi:hypothetical protein
VSWPIRVAKLISGESDLTHVIVVGFDERDNTFQCATFGARDERDKFNAAAMGEHVMAFLGGVPLAFPPNEDFRNPLRVELAKVTAERDVLVETIRSASNWSLVLMGQHWQEAEDAMKEMLRTAINHTRSAEKPEGTVTQIPAEREAVLRTAWRAAQRERDKLQAELDGVRRELAKVTAERDALLEAIRTWLHDGDVKGIARALEQAYDKVKP